MPYISPHRRKHLDFQIEELQKALTNLGLHEGDLNYAITRLISFYFQRDPRYASINKVIGVLTNVGMEFYRRIAAPYEDQMRERNEDVQEFVDIFRS